MFTSIKNYIMSYLNAETQIGTEAVTAETPILEDNDDIDDIDNGDDVIEDSYYIKQKFENEYSKLKSVIYYNINASMRRVNYCQICNKYFNTDGESGSGYYPNHSRVVGEYVCQYHCDGYTVICSECRTPDTLKIIDFLYLEGRGVYMDWECNLDTVIVKRSNGDIEEDWKICKESPLKIADRYDSDVNSEKGCLIVYCYKLDDNDEKQMSKWVKYSDLKELNPTLKFELVQPSYPHLDEYRYDLLMSEIMYEYFENFKKFTE